MPSLHISSNQEKALEQFVRVDVHKFASLVDNLENSKTNSIRASSLFERVVEITGDKAFTNALCSQVLSLASFRRVAKRNVEEVVDALISGINNSSMERPVKEWFGSARDQLVKLLNSNAVRLPAKALHLSTDYTNIYSSAHLVTDIRPVFDGDRDAVLGAIVSQTMKIDFVSPKGEEQISLALDKDDMEKLISELNRALGKANVAKGSLASNVDVFVVGEETYGFG